MRELVQGFHLVLRLCHLQLCELTPKMAVSFDSAAASMCGSRNRLAEKKVPAVKIEYVNIMLWDSCQRCPVAQPVAVVAYANWLLWYWLLHARSALSFFLLLSSVLYSSIPGIRQLTHDTSPTCARAMWSPSQPIQMAGNGHLAKVSTSLLLG